MIDDFITRDPSYKNNNKKKCQTKQIQKHDILHNYK